MPLNPAEVNLQDVPYSDPRKTINLAGQLISSKVGIIKAIGHGIYRAQDPVCLAIGISAPDLSNSFNILNANKAGGGGESLEKALAATIGEAVERYCMLFYDKSTMVSASYREVEEDAAAPDLLRLYSREQVERISPNTRLEFFTEDSKIKWVWGYSLTSQRPRLVPASMVYMNYEYDEDEAAIGRNASSGLAAGFTLEEAILTGLYEIVERDAFTISWLHRKLGPKLRIDDPELNDVLKNRFYCDRPDVNLQIFDITNDIPIPCAFAVMRRPAEFGAALCVASVTRLCPKDVVRKSLSEIGQGLPYLRFLLWQLKDWEPKSDFSDLTTFDHHCTLYVKRPELVPKALAFCDEVSDEIALSQMPNHFTGRVLKDIEYCVEMLKKAGREVIVVEITTPDILEVGLRVVRVLVPGLVPLHGNYNFPFLGVKRLHEIPYQLSWERSGWDPEAGLNPYPHPFP